MASRPCVLTLGVVVMLVTAGCSSLPLADRGMSTLTPAPIPGTDTPDPDTRVLGPGLTGGGVSDPGALSSAHREALSGRSFTLVRNMTVTGPNGTLVRWDRRLQMGHGWSRYRYVRTQESTDAYPVSAYRPLLQAWYDGEYVYFRGVRDEVAIYSRQRGRGIGDTTRADRLLALYAHFETRVEEREGGGYRVIGSDPVDETVLDLPLLLTDPRNARVVVDIDEEGRALGYQLTYRATFDDGPVRVTRRARFSAVDNTSVDVPEWLDEARNVTGQSG